MLEMSKFLKEVEKLPENEKEFFLKQMEGSLAILDKSMPGAKEIERAQKIINFSDVSPDLYTERPYLITTRNQKYLDKTLPNEAESAFTILSAGDTLFELVSRGVKDVTAVDVNDLQNMVYKLRRASIMTLSAKDFENFLINTHTNKFMSPEIFKTVKEALDKDDIAAQNFWEQLITINPKEDLANFLFKGVGGDVSKTLNALPFVKRKVSYYELREKLEKVHINILNVEAFEYFQANPEAKYDYIDFNNILLFTYQLECREKAKKYKQKLGELKTIYDKNLNAGGTFVIDHFFGITLDDLDISGTDKVNEYTKKIYNLTYDYLCEIFDIESFNVSKLIDGFGNSQDTVLLARKKY